MNWSKAEPVRTYLYSLLAPVVALLIGYGLVSEQHASLWVGLAAAVLGVTGVEAARKRVTPTKKFHG